MLTSGKVLVRLIHDEHANRMWEACMATLVHPCRVKSFLEAVASAVMDVLSEVLANKD